jgi:hypothetical protein
MQSGSKRSLWCGVVSQILASWNHLDVWLRQLEGVRFV